MHRVVVPMKPLAESKTRLRRVLAAGQRELLSLSMLTRVLGAARQASSVGEIVVVGGDAAVRELSLREGAVWRPEPGRDLNETLGMLFAEPSSEAGQTTTYLPADLPLVTAPDVEALVSGATGVNALVIAPDRRRQGTNGLTPPAGLSFEPLLGEHSFSRHREAAERSGLTVVLCDRPGLAFDLDTPDDLDDLLTIEPGYWERARAAAGADAGVGA